MFTVGRIQVGWYAFFFVAGLVGGYLLAARALRADGYDVVYANLLLIFTALGAVVGARLGEVLFYDWSHYRARPGDILKIWQGGLASHGAAIGSPLMLWLYARVIVRRPFLWVLDRAVAGIAFGAACVRFGNLMNSEILGTPADVPWAFVFERVDRVPRHPVQLYEGLWYLALSAVLLLLRARWQPRLGGLSGLFLLGMFVPRFFLELLKDSPIIAAGLSTGQLLSLPFIAIGALMLWWSSRRVPGAAGAGSGASAGSGVRPPGSHRGAKRRRRRG
jgi:prolipoprotein diacylglyceryl transferase